MRIARDTLKRRWMLTSLAALIVFAAVAALDLRLALLSGAGTAALQDFSTAAQFQAAFFIWRDPALAAQAGFALGLDYLLMPLYAATFFYSGIIAREAFAPRAGRLRRILALAAIAPVAGALLDAAENALELWMWLSGPNDSLARIAHAVSNAKMAAVAIGVLLFIAALLAEVRQRKTQRKPSA